MTWRLSALEDLVDKPLDAALDAVGELLLDALCSRLIFLGTRVGSQPA